MENIKLESDLRLEVIFISITKETLPNIIELSKLKELDILERQNINKFIYIINQLNTAPSIDILKKEFPDLYFDGIEKVSNESLPDYIDLYISYKKNLATSKKLMEIANKVRTNGLDETSITQLNNITKSDNVFIPYTSIEDNIIEIYNNKVINNDLNICVSAIDKETGGLQPRNCFYYFRIRR